MSAVPLDVVDQIASQHPSQPPVAPHVHISLNVRGLSQSSTLAINEHSARLERAGRKVFRMGLGQSPFPVPASVVEALKANAARKDYLPVRGLEPLREAVAAYHRRTQGVARTADDVLIGPGSKELLFILQLCFYGDLLVPSPSWVSYAPQAAIAGRQQRWIDTRREDGWRLTPEGLDAACCHDPDRPRILILNYPSNPLGVTYSEAELRALARVARRYGLVVLSDEIYGELHHQGAHASIARWYPEGTIISGGLSKWAGAGGWRLGTFCFPPQLRGVLDAMAVVASESYTSVSNPIQHAAITAFDGGPEIQRYLDRSRRVLRQVGPAIAARLRAAGCHLDEPEGGFYLFPDLGDLRERLAARGIHDARLLCERLLTDTGVAMLPGSDFGRSPAELSLRLAYVNFDGAAALEGAAALNDAAVADAGFLAEYCADCMAGIERMAQWLEAL
ncbi:pyridoxal phosphate-dependent aminotransferase [Thiohalocapsa sp. ML1]|jgi:aspartate aminotransferase|uniref:pyridoxal phosphate-dependent aminotransferase n=1 Tax=Thiohalocapsa sp. ML1 TaxID=1431688 RepID=UPI0009EBA793|nr:aminotransferase class I/II-fold pyridoxal phosphate-dependent enzyme [Thiohalocapsa sp. ML1]